MESLFTPRPSPRLKRILPPCVWRESDSIYGRIYVGVIPPAACIFPVINRRRERKFQGIDRCEFADGAPLWESKRLRARADDLTLGEGAGDLALVQQDHADPAVARRIGLVGDHRVAVGDP